MSILPIAQQLRDLKAKRDEDIAVANELLNEGVLTEAELETMLRKVNEKFSSRKAALIEKSAAEEDEDEIRSVGQKRSAPNPPARAVVTPQVKAPKPSSIFRFPMEWTFFYPNEESWIYGKCFIKWKDMKSTKLPYKWGYAKGNSLVSWFYLRPDVNKARIEDNLMLSEILSLGTKNVHYFEEESLAVEYFKSRMFIRPVTFNEHDYLPLAEHKEEYF